MLAVSNRKGGLVELPHPGASSTLPAAAAGSRAGTRTHRRGRRERDARNPCRHALRALCMRGTAKRKRRSTSAVANVGPSCSACAGCTGLITSPRNNSPQLQPCAREGAAVSAYTPATTHPPSLPPSLGHAAGRPTSRVQHAAGLRVTECQPLGVRRPPCQVIGNRRRLPLLLLRLRLLRRRRRQRQRRLFLLLPLLLPILLQLQLLRHHFLLLLLQFMHILLLLLPLLLLRLLHLLLCCRWCLGRRRRAAAFTDCGSERRGCFLVITERGLARCVLLLRACTRLGAGGSIGALGDAAQRCLCSRWLLGWARMFNACGCG